MSPKPTDAPVVMEVPPSLVTTGHDTAESPAEADQGLPTQERVSASAVPDLAPAGKKPKISPDGRRLLREGMAALMLPSSKGNALADWLDKHPNAVVTIRGKTPEPPLRVFGTPDITPMPDRRAVVDGSE